MSKSVLSVSVCIALLAASAAVSGAYAANDKTTKISAISSTNRAYAALVDGRHKTAIKGYTTAIESRTLPTENLGRSLLNRALAYQNSGKYQNAIADYTAAMRLDALSSGMRSVAVYNRGLAYEKSGNAAMAIEDFTSALLLDPKFSQSYYSRANVLRSHGQYLLAIADYKKARRYNHSKPHLTLFGEALTYEALNQETKARALLVKAVEAKPDFQAARNKLADWGSNAPLPAMASAKKRRPVRIVSFNPTADNLITGSISPSKADVTIRKTSLPAPVGVPKSISTASNTFKMPPLPDITNLVPVKTANRTSKTSKTVKVAAKMPVKAAAKTPVNTAKAAPSQAASGWTVQLSSQRNSDAAWDAWKNMSARYSSLLKGQQATVVKADLGSRGIFYRLRVHQIDSKKKAARLCSKLKRKGQGCFVSKA